MTLNEEAFNIHSDFHESLDRWAKENIEEIARIHGNKFEGWIRDCYLQETDYNSGKWQLYIRTEHGASYEGYYDGENYYLPLQYVYNAEFRANYIKQLEEKRAEEQRQADLKEKERIEVGIKMEMAKYEELRAKYGSK